MRGFFGLIGLLLALVVTGLVIRHQMKTLKKPASVLQIPSIASTDIPASAAILVAPVSGNAMQQSQQIQQQVKQAVEGAMQTRPMADEQ